MSKIFGIIILLLVIGAVILGVTAINDSLNTGRNNENSMADSQLINQDGIKWFQPESQDFNLAIFEKQFEVNYTPSNAQSVTEQSYLNDYVLAVNGSYYRGSPVEAEHAGMLVIDGEVFFPAALDEQLTHLIIYNKEAESIDFIRVEEAETEDLVGNEDITIFQTGPLLIENNEIQTELIDNSTNGGIRALRTVFGFTDDCQKFFLVTRRNYTLMEISEQIKKIDIFQGKTLNVINLDGGASTSMYSSALEQFNFMSSRRLPVVIGIK